LLVVLGTRHFEQSGVPELLAGGVLLLAMGMVDDRGDVRARYRFLVQVIASCLMIFAAGVVLYDFGFLLANWPLYLGWASIPATVFCVLGVTNATNMIDGMDGLSGSLALVALAGLQMAAWQSGYVSSIPEIPVLAGAVSAYLLFNLNLPWRDKSLVFFGDAGTLLLGFVLAWLFVELSQGTGRVIAPVTALWLFAVPLLDTVFLMIKRKLAGKSMVEADREHLHHAFLRSGWSVNQSLAVIVLGAIGFAGFGLVLERYGVAEFVSFYAFLAVSGLYYFGMSRVWGTGRFLGNEIK